MSGFVYAIGDGEGRVKIGWSADPIRRLSQINTNCPQSVGLLGVIEATKEQEAEAHNLLAPWRVSGEWFFLEGPVQKFIEMLPRPVPRIVLRGSYKHSTHPLSRWLTENCMTTSEFAKLVGVTQGMISLLCSGQSWVSRDTAHKIVEVTRGEVTPNDLLGL